MIGKLEASDKFRSLSDSEKLQVLLHVSTRWAHAGHAQRAGHVLSLPTAAGPAGC